MTKLKQAIRIFKNQNFACALGLYFLKYHDWTKYQMNSDRPPQTIQQAISFANRILNRIPENKSSNVSSEVQQHFVNTHNYMTGKPVRSSRGFVDESFYNECENIAFNMYLLNYKTKVKR